MAADANSSGRGDLEFVQASKHRRAVVDRLADSLAVPSQIAEDTSGHISDVSAAIGQLRRQGIVDLLVNEDRHKGRIYGLTDAGERVAEQLEKDEGGEE